MPQLTRGTSLYSVTHGDNILISIVNGLESVTGTSMESLPRVGDTVNIDGLVKMIDEDPSGSSRASFEYLEYTVIVTSDSVEIFD